MKKALLSFALLIVFLVGFLWFREIGLFMVGMDGFMYPDDEVKSSLINGGKETKDYNAVAVDEIDEVYLQHNDYFIRGENKHEKVSLDLPLISKNGSRILVLEPGEAITDTFIVNTTFRGAVVADGTMYSMMDRDQVDRNKYIFLKINSELFVNTYDITIDVLSGSKTIPATSLIYFEKNALRYYSLNDEKTKYIFKEITGIDLKYDVTIGEQVMTYEELLQKLGIWQSEREETQEEETPAEETEKAPIEKLPEPKKEKQPAVVDKLEVSASFVSADTYYATFNFYIHDPNGEIVRYPTVEIQNGNKTYVRKTFYATSKAEISNLLPDTDYSYEIYYTYKNSEGRMYQITLDQGTFKTKSKEGIEAIVFSHKNVTTASEDATIEGLKLENNISDKVLRGLASIAFVMDGREIKLGSDMVAKLRQLESLDYTFSKNLKSNTFYHLVIKAYDVAGNELVTRNSEINFKTTKTSPTAKISVDEASFTWFKATVNITNNDDVNITNLRYVLLDGSRILREGNLTGDYVIREEDLADNGFYQLLVYADYDLDDGYGNRINQLLAETNIATISLSTLGDLRLAVSNKEIKKDTATFEIGINDRTTDTRLINLLSTIVIDISDKDGNLFKTIEISPNDIDALKRGEVVDIILRNLNSNTEYTMEARSKLKQGGKEYDVKTILSVREFKTLKSPAEVEIINRFSTSTTIDYTVRIVDPDGSITSDRVIMGAERVNGNAIGAADLPINGEYQRFTYNKLEKDVDYQITFVVEGYNEGFTDLTAETNKELASIIMHTSEGVSGNIALESLLRQQEGKNYYEIDNLQRWKDVSAGGNDTSTTTNRRYDKDSAGRQVTFLSVKNGWRVYSYFLPELAGRRITVSFDAKKEVIGSDSFTANVANDDSSISSCAIRDLTTSYKHYSCSYTLGAKGYVGFYLSEVSAQNHLTEIAIRNLQIETGASETSYEPYRGKNTYLATTRVTMQDLRREIPGNDYYIKVYKFGELVQEIREKLDSNGAVSDKETKIEVDLNANYIVKLSVRIGGADYDISTTEFTTSEEIRSVRTMDEFKKMHITGKYYIIEDLDFRGQTGTIFTNFYGEIDFQGNKMIMDVVPSYLIRNFYGVIKNVDIHVYATSPSSASVFRWHWGFSESNYGTMEKFYLTLEDSIPGSAYYSISFLSRYNYGLVDTFVIHFKVSMYGIYNFSPITTANYGIIRNGYAYGDEGTSMEPHYDKSYESKTKYVGVFAAHQYGNGRLENVYSLLNVDGDVNIYDNNYLEIVGNLVGYADAGATMSHVYSNADGKDRNLSVDINWQPGSDYNPSNPSNYTVDKMYYVLSEEREALNQDFAQKGSTKISPWALKDVGFQNDVLNTYGAFDVDSFVKYGYYPHVIMPEVMPNQDYIPLPVPTSDEAPDVVAVKEINREGNDSAMITLSVRNYYQRDITSIAIENISTEIISQTHKNRYTNLVIRVSNPTRYLSRYSVSSISNGTVTTYGTNERIIDVEMQKEIRTIQDWKAIKSRPNENHILMEDLDFAGVSATDLRVNANFKGKFEGNGHTIKNIKIDSGDSMFTSVYGIIQNLFVENYEKTSLTDNAGFISVGQRGAQLKNIHLKNINILGNAYIGGLVGQMTGVTVEDCSVVGMSLYNIETSYNQAQLGGITGYMANSSTIRNSFVRDIDFDIRKSPNINTVGGIVGRFVAGTIDSVYASGKIQTKMPSNGGIVGQAENYGVLSHAYSDVDIFSTSNMDIGGIVGEVMNPARYVVDNTLSVGAIYSSLSGGTVRRTLGGDIAVSQANFAWHDQHINGVITDEISGEILLSTDELNLAETYTRVIGLGGGFSYDGIGDNSLPLLYSVDGINLLPNQEKIFLKTYDFELNYVEIQQGVDAQGVDNAWIYLEINNPDEVEITGITIEDVIIKQVTQNRNSEGITYYRMEVNPIYYYDSYRLSEIKYRINGIDGVKTKDSKIEMQFFRDLWNVQDWQKIEKNTSENYRLRANIDFSGVSDVNHGLYINRLDGFENGYTLSNITINHNDNNVGLFHVINSSLYNITFDHVVINNTANSRNTGIVLFGYGRAEKLVFNDITINAKNCSYSGIVADDYASDTRNIMVNNSNIYGTNHVGGYAGRIKPFSVTTVDIKNTNVIGTSTYVGGFAGEQWTANYLLQYGITVDNVTVKGTAYIGGIYGRGAGSDLRTTGGSLIDATKSGNDTFAGGISGRVNMSVEEMPRAYVDNVTIKGSGAYIGGITGYSDKRVTASSIENVVIDGKGTGYYVGGISGGVNGNYSITYSKVGNDGENAKVIIQNVGSNVGGICGYNCYTGNNVVNNATIEGSGNNIGGIAGRGYSTTGSLVTNTSIKGNSYVGGVVGFQIGGYTVSTDAVVNSTITANTNAGGLAGGSDNVVSSYTNYHSSTVNATSVTASGDNAGGLIGYLNNKEYTRTVKDVQTYYARQRAYYNIIENTNVSARTNAGGLIGKIDVSEEYEDGLQTGRIYNNIVSANSVTTTSDSKEPGVFFGNDDSLAYRKNGNHALRATNMKVFEDMKLIGSDGAIVLAKNYTGNNFDINSDKSTKMLNLANLKTASTYTDLSMPFNTSQITTYYPYLNLSTALVQVSQLLVPLPQSNMSGMSLNSVNSSRMITSSVSYHILPTYIVYPSDINTINIEFSNTDDESIFMLNGETYRIDNRVYSFNYNYDQPLEIKVTDGQNSKEEIIRPDSLRGTVATIGENYYFINDKGELVTNNNEIAIDAEIKNLFKGKVLTKDNRIIDLESGIIQSVGSFGTEWIGRAMPLYEFESDETQISVFAKYTLIDGVNEVEKQLLIKGIQAEIISPSIKNKKWQVIMDSYNNKDYLTILGTDGVMYDLKNKLSYPDNFINEGITEISSNVSGYSRIIIVRYENGKIVVFDYRNGKTLFKQMPEEIPSPIDYYFEQLSPDSDKMYDNGSLEKAQQNITELEDEIKRGSVMSEKNEILPSARYVSAYDPVKNEYELYEMGELLKADPLGISATSISDKIYGDYTLNLMFGHYLSHSRDDNIAAIIIYVGIGITITISMVALGDLLRRKYSIFEENDVQ